MTTEQSVLEKLKLYQNALLQCLTAMTLFEAGKISEALKNAAANNFIDNQEALEETFPRLIAALELVEEKAAMKHSSEGHSVGAYTDGCNDGEIEFAREVLALLNNTDNKENKQ